MKATPLRFTDWFTEYTEEEYAASSGRCDCCGEATKLQFALSSEDPGACVSCAVATLTDEDFLADVAEHLAWMARNPVTS